METNLLLLLLVGGFVGAAAGYLGSFMVLKRMSLVGDALSHVALPGMAAALVWHFSPMAGAFIALTMAVVGIWYFAETAQQYPEALFGIFFTTSLALGVLLTPQPDLLEALFGNIEKMTFLEGVFAVALSVAIIIITKLIAKKLILGIVSEDLLKSLSISSRKINLVYLVLIGGVVALGVKFIGTLLMGALVIIPAASAKNISNGIANYYFFSAVFGIVSSIIGINIAYFYHVSSGPSVVLTGVVIFLFTYFCRKFINKFAYKLKSACPPEIN